MRGGRKHKGFRDGFQRGLVYSAPASHHSVGDAEALGAQLAEILGTPGRAGKLGVEGRRVAEAELSQERMVDRIVAVYDELLMPRTRE